MAADLEQGGIHLHQLNSDISPNREEEELAAVDALCKVDETYLNPEEKQRLRTWGDAIQPSTNEGGDTSYIGDIYTGINKLVAAEWHLEHPGEYLQFVKNASQMAPELEYLAHWMEVATSPLKWRFLRNHPASREERARRVKACVLDYSAQMLMCTEHCGNVDTLKATINAVPPDCKVRIVIAEDISRDLVEALGLTFNLDPHFFRHYIDDYLFFNARDPWATHPNLLSEATERSCMAFTFLRARYYADDAEFEYAQRQSGTFNVLRCLDSDRSRGGVKSLSSILQPVNVGLARSKVAIWFEKANDRTPVIAVVLCDPTVTPGKPLWKGIGAVQGELRPTKFVGHAQPAGDQSLFDHFVQAYGSLTTCELEQISASTQMIAQPALKITIKEWLLVIQYMTAQVLLMEWEFQRPRFAEDPADLAFLAKKAEPWRRSMRFYKNWVRDMLEHISIIATNEKHTGTSAVADQSPIINAHPGGLQILIPDLERILRRLDEISEDIERLSVMSSSASSLAEAKRSRKAIQQNQGLGRLSFLATIFLPLNLATSLLSMSPDFSSSQNTFRLFFAIGIPLNVIVVSFVGCMQLKRQRYTLRRRLWNTLFVTKHAS